MKSEHDSWVDGLEPGDSVKIYGALHDGETGMVVKWNPEWGTPRSGSVPVYLPKYAATFFWWFGPGNLKRLI